jgi:hypothetical protein
MAAAPIVEVVEAGDLQVRVLLWQECEGIWSAAWQFLGLNSWHPVRTTHRERPYMLEAAVDGALAYLASGRARTRRLKATSLAADHDDVDGNPARRGRPISPRVPQVTAEALRQAFAPDATQRGVNDSLFDQAIKLAFPRTRARR